MSDSFDVLLGDAPCSLARESMLVRVLDPLEQF